MILYFNVVRYALEPPLFLFYLLLKKPLGLGDFLPLRREEKEKMPTDIEDEIKDEKNPRPLDEDDIALLKTYVRNMFFFSKSPNNSSFA